MSNTPTDTTDTTDTRTARGADTGVDAVDTGTMKWLSALAALLGLWIAASPFVFESTDVATWNCVLVGAAIALLAAYNYSRLSDGRLANVGAASLAALLGLWALASPFLLEMGSDALLWSTAVSGLIVAAISGYNAYANNKADTPARTTTTART